MKTFVIFPARNEAKSAGAKVIQQSKGVFPAKGRAMKDGVKEAIKRGADCIVFLDADIVNLTPDWVDLLAEPVIEKACDMSRGYYRRAEYDGAVTKLIANKGVDAVITGNCGPNTYKVLDAAGVKVFVGAEGTVREAVAAYKEGKLKVISQPKVTAGSGSNKKRRPDSIRLLFRRIDIRYLIPGCKAQKGAVSFKFLGSELALYWPHPGRGFGIDIGFFGHGIAIHSLRIWTRHEGYDDFWGVSKVK